MNDERMNLIRLYRSQDESEVTAQRRYVILCMSSSRIKQYAKVPVEPCLVDTLIMQRLLNVPTMWTDQTCPDSLQVPKSAKFQLSVHSTYMYEL